MNNLYEITISKKSEILNEINNLFNDLCHYLNLETVWKKNSFKEIELKKCYIRGIIRESSIVGDLQEYIVKELKQRELFKNYNFFSKFYPMIHLPGDEYESSNYLHYDQDDKIETYTCWLPITNNEYKEISLFKYENFLVNYFIKFISKIKIFNFFSKKINSKYGNCYIWSGKRLHKGNLNISKKSSCAIQMKISKKELSKEQSKSSLIKGNLFEYNKNTKSQDYYRKNFDIFRIFIEYLDNLNNNEFDNFKDLIKKIEYLCNQNIIENTKETSFSLSVFSQRIRQSVKNDNKTLFNCLCYDTASIILGSSNLVSFFRILKDVKFFFKYDRQTSNLTDVKELKEIFLKT